MAIISNIGLKLTAEGGQQVQRELQLVGKTASDTGKSSEVLSSAFGRLRGLFVGFSAAVLVRDFVQTADAMTAVNARLKLATTSTQEYAQAQRDVYRISQSQGTALRETADLYARLADPIRKLGGSSKEVAGITEALAASLRISGTTGAAAAGAITQFAQAMASGALRGDEFNSVNEAAPRLMQALESALGKTRGELRKMAEQGQLTADVVGNALVGQLGKLQAESATLPETVGTAFQKLQNELGLFVAGANEATGATSTLVTGLTFVADLVGQFSTAFKGAGAATRETAAEFGLLDVTMFAVGKAIETVVLIGSDVAAVMKGIGLEIGGLAAQAAALVRGDFSQIGEIHRLMKADAEANRKELEAFQNSIAGATDRVFAQRKALQQSTVTASENTAEMAKLARQSGLTADSLQRQANAAGDGANATKAAAAAAKLAEQQAKEQEAAEKRLLNAVSAKTAVTEESVRALDFYSATVPEVLQLTDAERQAIASAADEYERVTKSRQEWAETVQAIEGGLTDALMRSFESGKGFMETFRDTLVNAFKSLVLQPTIKAIISPVAGALGSLFTGSGGLLGLLGGGGGSSGAAGGGGGSLLSMLGLANSGIVGGLQTQLLGLGDWLATSNNGLFASAGEFLQGNYAGLGSIGAGFGGFLAGRGLGQLIGGGYSIGGSGNGIVNAGSALGAIFGGPIGAAIGGALGGAVNRLFGRKLKDSGIEGTLSTAGIDGNAFEFYKGGLFRSDKTKRSELDPGIDAVFDAGISAATATVRAYVGALGLPVDAIAGYSEQIKLSFKDLSEDEIRQLIADTVNTYQANLAGVYAQALSQYARAGETAIQTLERLGQLEAASQSLNSFGGVFSRIAALGIDARESLIGLAGGVEALLTKTQDFVRLYYSEQEQAAIAARQILDNLWSAAPFEVSLSGLNSTAQYRQLLESQDLNSAEGQQRFNALLSNATAFAQVAQYLAANGGNIGRLAASAPANAALDTLFNGQAPTQEPLQIGFDSVAATVQETSNEVVSAIDRLREEVIGLRGDTGMVISNTAATTRQLSAWDDGGFIATSVGDGA